MLSIKVALLSVSRVGKVIAGYNPNDIKLSKYSLNDGLFFIESKSILKSPIKIIADLDL